MASDLAEKAKEAIIDDDFTLAVDLYSKAIDLEPTNANYFADRAQANIKLNNFTEAVADANKAIELDPSMAKAYLRKGTACIKIEEYHTAKTALKIGASLAQGDSRFTKLIKECDQHIAEESDDLGKSLTPNVPPNAAPVSVDSHQTETASPVKPKYRHEYFQKPEEVVLTVFAKGIPAENVSVDFGEQILSVTIDIPGEDPYHFQPRLFRKVHRSLPVNKPIGTLNDLTYALNFEKQIVPDKSRYQVLSTKIEIRLAKAEVINWTSLEYSNEITVSQKLNMLSVASQRPSYPSSKTRAKDWDRLEAQVKEEEKDEKLDGDAGLNKLFRGIYQNADEDMRRAMTKSFVESNGTVLSTDWKEVGAKKVEGSPPDGMEVRKWEY